MLLFLNICKQIFHISHVSISQNVKGVLMWNFRHIFSYEEEDIDIGRFLNLSVALINDLTFLDKKTLNDLY